MARAGPAVVFYGNLCHKSSARPTDDLPARAFSLSPGLKQILFISFAWPRLVSSSPFKSRPRVSIVSDRPSTVTRATCVRQPFLLSLSLPLLPPWNLGRETPNPLREPPQVFHPHSA